MNKLTDPLGLVIGAQRHQPIKTPGLGGEVRRGFGRWVEITGFSFKTHRFQRGTLTSHDRFSPPRPGCALKSPGSRVGEAPCAQKARRKHDPGLRCERGVGPGVAVVVVVVEERQAGRKRSVASCSFSASELSRKVGGFRRTRELLVLE